MFVYAFETARFILAEFNYIIKIEAFVALHRLTVGSGFGLTFSTRTEIGSGCPYFQPDPTRPDPTRTRAWRQEG